MMWSAVVWKSDWSTAVIMELEFITVAILKTLVSSVLWVHKMHVTRCAVLSNTCIVMYMFRVYHVQQ